MSEIKDFVDQGDYTLDILTNINIELETTTYLNYHRETITTTENDATSTTIEMTEETTTYLDDENLNKIDKIGNSENEGNVTKPETETDHVNVLPQAEVSFLH